MLISVVVPVKDDAAGLRRTLASLPERDELEIIVVDGGSDRDTLGVLEAAAPRLAYCESGVDTGIANAMNRGIERARGDYVAILNAGDAWLPDTLEQAMTAAQQGDAELLHGTVVYERADGSTYEKVPRPTRLAARMWMFHPTWFVNRDTYERLGGYDEAYQLAMDSEWLHRAVAAGVSMQQIDAPLAVMTLGGRSDVDFKGALAEYRRSVVRHKIASELRAGCWYYFLLAAKTLTAAVRRA